MANVANVKVRRGNKLVLSGSSVDVTGSLTTTGDVFVGGAITAREMKVSYVTSSILYESGSTRFGDTVDDNHEFTGSVKISGSLTATSLTGNGANLTNLSASQLNNFTNDVRGQFTQGAGIIITEGQISAIADITDVNAGVNLTGGGTSGSITLSLASSITGGLTNLTASNISGGLGRFEQLTASSASVLGALSASSVTGSYSGNGAGLTNLSASQLNNFSADVRGRLSGAGTVSYNPSTGVISSSVTQGVTSIVAGSNIGITTNGTVVTASLSSSVTGLTSVSSTAVTASNLVVNNTTQLNSSLARSKVAVSAAHVVTATNQIILATVTGSADLVVYLPAPSAIDGRELVIKRVDNATQTGAVVVSASAGTTIDGDAAFELNGPFQSITLIADSLTSKWLVI